MIEKSPDRFALNGVFVEPHSTEHFCDLLFDLLILDHAKKTDGTNLPSWLALQPLNRRFSGVAVTGTTAVRVTARDQWGKTVTDDFNITIS